MVDTGFEVDIFNNVQNKIVQPHRGKEGEIQTVVNPLQVISYRVVLMEEVGDIRDESPPFADPLDLAGTTWLGKVGWVRYEDVAGDVGNENQ